MFIACATPSLRGTKQSLYIRISEDTPIKNRCERIAKHRRSGLQIRFDGVGPVSNDLTPDNEARVWSYGGKAYFSLPAPTEVSIYTVSGTLYDRRTLPAGNTSIALPAGFYIIRTNNTTEAKILIN